MTTIVGNASNWATGYNVPTNGQNWDAPAINALGQFAADRTAYLYNQTQYLPYNRQRVTTAFGVANWVPASSSDGYLVVPLATVPVLGDWIEVTTNVVSWMSPSVLAGASFSVFLTSSTYVVPGPTSSNPLTIGGFTSQPIVGLGANISAALQVVALPAGTINAVQFEVFGASGLGGFPFQNTATAMATINQFRS